jgi:Ca-activated chloride channel family protein
VASHPAGQADAVDTLRTLSFAAPDRLWLLVGVALLVAATVGVARRRGRSAAGFAEPGMWAALAPDRPGWRRPVARAVVLLSLAVLVVAFAQPQVLASTARQRAVVIVGLDTSASMQAGDVAPSRFAAAQQAAQAFLAELPSYVDVGLVTYDARVTVTVAPTSDHAEVAAAIDRLQALGGGTALGDAVLTSLHAIPPEFLVPEQGKPSAASMVLLSDGGSTTGEPVATAIAQAVAQQVPVSTIAFGTPAGTVLSNGRTFDVPVDTTVLEQIAAGTSGTAYQAADAGQLSTAYAQVASRLTAETARHDLTAPLTGAALLLLLAAAAAAVLWSGAAP